MEPLPRNCGSADAAAILRAAGVTDLQVATSLGADVGFCLVGGRARVSGIGEIVESLPHVDRTFTLFTPPVHCSTSQIYAAWGRLGRSTDIGGNDLEPIALALYPEMAFYRDKFAEICGGRRPRLAGSGSTWFIEGAFNAPGTTVARTLDATASANQPTA